MANTTPGDTGPEASPRDLTAVTTTLAAVAHTLSRGTTSDTPISAATLLDALVLLRWAQAELADLEPILITAARAAGASWQTLAPALGVASRQAAERRYLRSTSAPTDQPGATRDARVQAERDRRAAHRAVTRWANDHTADLRQLAGQITALTDLDTAATAAITRLHAALGATQPHLAHHRELAAQIDTVTAHTDQIRRQPVPRHQDNRAVPG
jgi:hypothetical protein